MIRLALGFLGIAVLAGLTWFFWPSQAEEHLLVVTSQSVPTTLHEHAMLISAQRTPSKAGIGGTITSIITPGTKVKPGDELFTQDAADLSQKLDQYQAEIEEQQAGLDQHVQELALAKLEISKDEEINDAELAYQGFRLEQALAGPNQTERRLMAIKLELAAIDLREAQEALERNKRLVERGLQSASSLEDTQRTYLTRQTAMHELQIEQDLNNAGPTTVDIREIEADLERVQGKVDRARQARERRVNRIKRDIAIRKAQIIKSTANLQHTTDDAAKATRVAEVSGIAMPKSYRDWRSGGRVVTIGPGVQRWPGDVIVDIIDPEQLQAVVMINESDYPRLKTGMPVDIRLEAYPDRTFKGKISFLAGIGRDRGDIATNESEGSNTGVSVFSATIDFTADVELRPGMSGIVEIDLEDDYQALVVPMDWCEQDDHRGYWVWREGPSGLERIAINAQPYGSQGLRIIDGLLEGDRLRHPLDVGER